MKNKVVIIIDNLHTGGAQRQVIEYLKYRDREQFDFTVVNLDAALQTLTPEITKLGVNVIQIKHGGFFNIKTIFTLTVLLKNINPTIVQTYLFTADTYGRICAILAKTPIIITSIRSMDLWKKSHHLWIDRLLEKFTDSITINAESIRLHLQKIWKIDNQKIFLIHNGIDLNRFIVSETRQKTREKLGLYQSDLLIGMIGRFRFEKDYESFFQAAHLLYQQYPQAIYIAVGDGPKQQEIEQFVRTLNPQLRVIFTGTRHDTPNLIHAMDICVLATHTEGCPNGVMEYMAGGKPVIATHVGGCPELVVQGETGFLVEDKNTAAYAEAIKILIEDVSLRQQMGRAGKKRIEDHFSTQKLAQKTEDLYLSLLEKKAKGKKLETKQEKELAKKAG